MFKAVTAAALGLLVLGGTPLCAQSPEKTEAGEALLADVHAALAKAAALELSVNQQLSGRWWGAQAGKLLMDKKGQVLFFSRSVVRDERSWLKLVSDGKQATYSENRRPQGKTMQPPADLSQRMLRNLVSAGCGPMLVMFSMTPQNRFPAHLLEPTGLSLGGSQKIDGRSVRELRFQTRGGRHFQQVIDVSLWIDAKTQLPRRRVSSSLKGELRVVEDYSFDLAPAWKGGALPMPEIPLPELGAVDVTRFVNALAADQPLEARKAAIKALEELGPKAVAAVPALGAALRDPGLRRKAAYALRKIGDRAGAALPQLMEAAATQSADRSGGYRSDAIISIGQIGAAAAKAVPLLTRILKEDANKYVRQAAARSLGQIGPQAKSSAGVLTEAALRDGYVYVRLAAATSLGQVGVRVEEAFQFLRDSLQDKYLKLAAAEALAKVGNAQEMEQGFAILCETLRSGGDVRRGTAAMALGRIGKASEQVLDALSAASAAKSSVVQKFAKEALEQLRATQEKD